MVTVNPLTLQFLLKDCDDIISKVMLNSADTALLRCNSVHVFIQGSFILQNNRIED